MIDRRALLIALPTAAILAGCGSEATGAAIPVRAGNGLTVVELYESQGCSSCPPAIRNVNALADRKDLLVLTFSVTYWDYLGWKDSFGKPAFTARQRSFAEGHGQWGVYTPQVVVDGKAALVGDRPDELAGAMARTGQVAQLKVASIAGNLIELAAQPGMRQPADLWLVRYDPRNRSVQISRGENAGRRIDHRNIVVDITRLGPWDGSARRLALPAPSGAGLATALLVQQPGGGAIIAAAKI